MGPCPKVKVRWPSTCPCCGTPALGVTGDIEPHGDQEAERGMLSFAGGAMTRVRGLAVSCNTLSTSGVLRPATGVELTHTSSELGRIPWVAAEESASTLRTRFPHAGDRTVDQSETARAHVELKASSSS